MISFTVLISVLGLVFANSHQKYQNYPNFFKRSRNLRQLDGGMSYEYETWWRPGPDQLYTSTEKNYFNQYTNELYGEEVATPYENIGKLMHTKNKPNRKFLRYTEIESYIKNLAKSRSGIVSYFSIGRSTEGRDILCLKISIKDNSRSGWKPGILIDAGIHAREWISVSSALYAIEQLVDHTTNRRILEQVDVYVIPVLNPDGYEFSHQGGEKRLWRKSRSFDHTGCVGVDLNRNFNINLMASSGPCDDVFAGKAPMSEPESRALAKFMELYRGVFKVYVTLHSYGNFIFYPWGFSGYPPPKQSALKCTAAKAVEALSSVRRSFYRINEVGKSAYPASGMSMDYAMAYGGVDLAFTLELSDGRWEFTPPESEIKPVGQEFFAALEVFAGYVKGDICNNLNTIA